MMKQSVFNVAIGEIVTRGRPGILSSVFGSCLGVFLYDSTSQVGSLAHTVLPSNQHRTTHGLKTPQKYVNIAIHLQVKQLQRFGVRIDRLVAKLVGGAEMFEVSADLPRFRIGERNLTEAMEILLNYGIPIVATDVGKNYGRKARMDLNTGIVVVSRSDTDEIKYL